MTYNILACIGGGIRGVVTTTILERLLEAGVDLAANADLIAGTSTGGIIALGLAFGLSPSELTDLYNQHGGEIFDSSWLSEIADLGGLARCKYDNKKLSDILYQRFGNATLGQLKTNVVIPTFNFHVIDGGPARSEPRFMHNFDADDSDRELPVQIAALRTSAAPTYFPSVGTFIDGGVVANDPSLAAISRARRFAGVKLEDIRLLTLGTGVVYSHVEGHDLKRGDLEWLPTLLSILLDSPADAVSEICQDLLGDAYRKINPIFKDNIPLDAWQRCGEMIQIAKDEPIDDVVAWAKQNFVKVS